MSKVDVRVLNDLSESKKRVMTNVVQHLEQREMKKRSWRWQYSVMSIILTVCIGLFLYTQFSENQEQTASIPTVLDEKILELHLQRDSLVNGKDRLYPSSFNSFLSLESSFAYAQSKGLVPTQEEIDKNLKILMEGLSAEINPTLEERLQMLHLTKEEFIERYARPIAYKFAMLKLLWEHAQNEYPDVDDQILNWYVERDAKNYFEQHYSKEVASLREKYKIPAKESQLLHTMKGTVVAIKEHEFLVVSGVDSTDIGKLSADEIVRKHTNGTWFPLVDVPETLSIGDRVEVQYSESIRLDYPNPFIDFKDIVSTKIVEEY
ncbi:DUF3221 domain-containing protein [Lysinibacillus sp. fls2-241-R2A-57]|uniref:DUF3221 domain-containing protein n=1 Tax=Lysinibacillus sp. fls2-241-R2A-57 TaxID=3040292 RepID=UPI0025542F9D|nr:DUF3221 domain-containing protein [Lysinibacillus sp. fls2-241-R2A-57]